MPRICTVVLALVTGFVSTVATPLLGVASSPPGPAIASSAGPTTASPPVPAAASTLIANPAEPRAGPSVPPMSSPGSPYPAAPAHPAPQARQPSTPAERFGWPLAPPHPVLRPFQAPSTPYGPGHRGVDLGGSVGEPVLAAAAGVVVFAGDLAGRGVVSVDHPNGLRTTYEPVAPAVEAGRQVAAGAVLGHLRPGHPRCTGAPACLHWGVRRGEEYLDPLVLVSTGRVRLLPWKEET